MKRQNILIFFTMIFVLTSMAYNVEANEESDKIFVIDRSTTEVKLDSYIQYLVDENREYSINDMLSKNYEGEFKDYNGLGRPNFGYTNSAYWVKFIILNNTDQTDWLLEIETPKLNQTELYKVQPDGKYIIDKIGNFYPFDERSVKSTNLSYLLKLNEQEYVTYYLKVTTGSSMQLPLKLWEFEAFNKNTNVLYLTFGLLIGISFVMALYNTFLYFSIRDRSYLYYVLFVIANALLYLSDMGIAYQFLWPNSVTWNLHAVVFFMALDSTAALLFARNFLHTKHYLPKRDKVILMMIIVNGLLSVWALFSATLAMYATIISTILTILIIIPTAIITYQKGYRPARIFILAWGVFLTGAFISLLVDTGLFPLTSLTKNAWLYTTVMEVILLSLALGDRYNLLNKEFQKIELEKKENQQKAIDNLKKVDKLRDEFLTSTSHELRTPLNGIIGIAETMREGIVGEVSPEMDKHLDMIATSGKRLSNLVNDILDFSKLKNDNLYIQQQSVNLRNVTEIVLQVCNVLVKNKDIELLNHVDKDLPLVVADPDRLQQILYNLIGNAIKYTDQGEVIISAKEEREKIIVEINDTGKGITKEILPTIFEPFHQEIDRMSIEGTGIGLYVTKKLVELHGGEIYVYTVENEGTSFYFTLDKSTSQQEVKSIPLNTDLSVSQPSTIDTKVSIQNQKSENRKTKILIADDEHVNLQVLQNHLLLNGYTVFIVSSGQEVIKYIEKHTVNLLILDIMMPGMSGYEVCKKLREKYSLNELPILMLTAKNQLNDKIVSFNVGANDYLTKPCDKEELLARVHTLIQLSAFHHKVMQMNEDLEKEIKERTQELELSNEELNKSNLELQEMTESRQELLQNIAHEIGTPITVIQGYLQGIQQGLININEKKYLNMVFRKVNVLNRLINDLNDLSNLKAGRFNLNVKQFALKDFIEIVKEKVETDAERNQRKFKLNKDLPHEKISDFYCFIDLERIIQVLTNITRNAIKHTDALQGSISLGITLKNGNRELIIQLTDNGKGIDQKFLPHIFERFYKHGVSSLDDNVSSGLGLAITKEIVDAHEGNIWIESKKGVGTSLFISLPIYELR